MHQQTKLPETLYIKLKKVGILKLKSCQTHTHTSALMHIHMHTHTLTLPKQ